MFVWPGGHDIKETRRRDNCHTSEAQSPARSVHLRPADPDDGGTDWALSFWYGGFLRSFLAHPQTLSIYLSIDLSIYLPVYPHMDLSIHASIYPIAVYLLVDLSICLSLCLSVYLFT